MEFKDYYKILGVNEKADAKDIKASYRKLARKYHPDMNSAPQAGEKFKEVAEAYEVLKDPDKRAQFDELRRFGEQPQSGHGFTPPPGWQHSHQGDPRQGNAQYDGQFSDFFNSIFGGGFNHSDFDDRAQNYHHQQQSRGQDVETDLTLSLQETLHQQIKTIEYQLRGAAGAGGKLNKINKQLNVKIPQGVMNGERIRLKGQGMPGSAGGQAGDLYLHIHLSHHPLFEVQKLDLLLMLPLAPWEAALGSKVTVPTLEGKVNLTIAPNCPSGKKLRIKGKGLKRKNKTGDLYVITNVIMPPESNAKAQQLWRELAINTAFDPRSLWGEY